MMGTSDEGLLISGNSCVVAEAIIIRCLGFVRSALKDVTHNDGLLAQLGFPKI